MDLTDLDAALATATAAVRVPLDASQSDYLRDLLTLTAGKDAGGVVVYRPWYAAWLLVSYRHDRLVEAEGVKWLSQADVLLSIAHLLRLQAAYDSEQGLLVPSEYAAGGAVRAAVGVAL